ncbi:MAG: hypothetical protein C0615_03145 [Desulfuromonas sp.]|nr:MAG: hypothetical protein C0615_03145 [Desulfuromonas sp.]
MKCRWIAPIILFVLLVVPASVVRAELAPGTVAPDFELTDMAGQKVRLADYKGHPFILKLATTWCPSCRQQSAQFEKAQDFLAENKIPVIEVFVDDTEDEVRKYIEKHPLAGTHVKMLDDGRVYKAYNVYLIPRVIVVDAEFKIKRDGSVIDASMLKSLLQKML